MLEIEKVIRDRHGKVFLSIRTDTEEGLIYSKWKGKPSLDDIKTGSLAYLDVLNQYRVSKLISDNTELETSWQTLNDWVEHTWTPRAIALGLKWFALVVSPLFFVKLSAVDLTRRISDKLEIRIFNDMATARRWMTEVCHKQNNLRI